MVKPRMVRMMVLPAGLNECVMMMILPAGLNESGEDDGFTCWSA